MLPSRIKYWKNWPENQIINLYDLKQSTLWQGRKLKQTYRSLPSMIFFVAGLLHGNRKNLALQYFKG
jgi:hypothetical protein